MFIIDAVRTPIGKYGGSLSSVRADTLAAVPIKALLDRNSQVPPAAVEEVYLGCANQAGEDNRNVARMAALLAGLPDSVAGETVNRLCASGLSAVINAERAIHCGQGEVMIAGGIEHMTRSPFVVAKSEQPYDRKAEMFDTTIGWRFINPEFQKRWGVDSMGQTAENLAELYSISRADQDLFAHNSQQRAAKAIKSQRFAREIVHVDVGQKNAVAQFSLDEFPRPQTTIEDLSRLRPAFKDGGSVTAGNSSGITDGACALLLASDKAVKQFGLHPKAQIIGAAAAGVEPRVMGIGPVHAVKKVLDRSGLSLAQMDIIEINEAFAVQVLACLHDLGLSASDPRLNPNGGAIALGHPLGMSGARLCATAMYELIEQNKRYALVTMCVGVGQGYAAILERIC